MKAVDIALIDRPSKLDAVWTLLQGHLHSSEIYLRISSLYLESGFSIPDNSMTLCSGGKSNFGLLWKVLLGNRRDVISLFPAWHMKPLQLQVKHSGDLFKWDAIIIIFLFMHLFYSFSFSQDFSFICWLTCRSLFYFTNKTTAQASIKLSIILWFL